MDLIEETQRYATLRNAIAQVKKQLKNGSFTYMAGSLIISARDELNKTDYISLTVESLNDIECPLKRELMYLTSQMYVAHKNEKHSFYQQALENIKQYENELQPQ